MRARHLSQAQHLVARSAISNSGPILLKPLIILSLILINFHLHWYNFSWLQLSFEIKLPYCGKSKR